MVSGRAQIETDKWKRTVPLAPLQVAEIAAHAVGFNDIDMKDNDFGNYRLIAYGKGTSIQGRGKTIEEAVENLLEKIL